ncbi:MAG: class I SAM-dependent methyltransferase [Lewinellaceae bacterium]|nr:class I SAM-dependent methyltransferase [Lewinellaceae bacterium]MCB9290125.1 class I SAM-dependent methyltransferase [Lewinellaceae bacterium]
MSTSRPHTDTLYSRLLARFYDPIMSGAEKSFLEEKRRQLLGRARGKVLEVGAGTGANFHLYNARAEVLAIEPSGAMLKYARKRLEKEGVTARIQLLKAGIGDDEVRAVAPEAGFDYIVCTLVLCTVPGPGEALDLFRQLLKPGGQLLIVEHIQDNRQPQRWLQRAVTPAWKHLSEGCHLDRPTDELLKAQGFRAVEEAYFYRWVPFYWAVLEMED